MAYDEQLAGRIRSLTSDAVVTEKHMFGGLAFLVQGNMAVAASGQGGLLVRVDPGETDELLAATPAEAFVMRGRSMSGWLRVPAEAVPTDADLEPWVERGIAYASALPPKPPQR